MTDHLIRELERFNFEHVNDTDESKTISHNFCAELLKIVLERDELRKIIAANDWERKANEYFNSGLRLEKERDRFKAALEFIDGTASAMINGRHTPFSKDLEMIKLTASKALAPAVTGDEVQK